MVVYTFLDTEHWNIEHYEHTDFGSLALILGSDVFCSSYSSSSLLFRFVNQRTENEMWIRMNWECALLWLGLLYIPLIAESKPFRFSCIREICFKIPFTDIFSLQVYDCSNLLSWVMRIILHFHSFSHQRNTEHLKNKEAREHKKLVANWRWWLWWWWIQKCRKWFF